MVVDTATQGPRLVRVVDHKIKLSRPVAGRLVFKTGHDSFPHLAVLPALQITTLLGTALANSYQFSRPSSSK